MVQVAMILPAADFTDGGHAPSVSAYDPNCEDRDIPDYLDLSFPYYHRDITLPVL